MSKTQRLNLEISYAEKQRIQRLRELTDAHTVSEVVRRALATYEALWQQREQGGVVVIRFEDGQEKELLLP